MNTTFSLDKLPVGRCGIVQRLHTVGNIRRRLLDIGLIENTVVECIGKSPAGDPLAFLIRGAVIAIRREDCRTVDISIEEEKTLWD